MANGFTSPGSFNQNRKASAFFGSPYANTPFTSVVYSNQATKAKFAYWILSSGNNQSSRINNYNPTAFAQQQAYYKTLSKKLY
jgi:hypothetical protein